MGGFLICDSTSAACAAAAFRYSRVWFRKSLVRSGVQDGSAWCCSSFWSLRRVPTAVLVHDRDRVDRFGEGYRTGTTLKEEVLSTEKDPYR